MEWEKLTEKELQEFFRIRSYAPYRKWYIVKSKTEGIMFVNDKRKANKLMKEFPPAITYEYK
jgi:hypothetical protein